MGSAAFSIRALDALITSPHHVVGVITNHGKPAGRGLKNRSTPVAERAGQHNIDTVTPVTLRNNGETAEWIRRHAPDAIVVVAYGKFIPPDILHIPADGCLNLHPSLLPEYRGAAPIQRALMNGETKTGVTVMLLDEGMDSGPLFMQEETGIEFADNAMTLGAKLSKIGAELLIKTLSSIEQRKIQSMPQAHELATFAPKIEKTEGELHFSKSALELHNTVRALIEWPTAWTFYKGSKIQVLKTEPIAGQSVYPPAAITGIDKNGISVATGQGTLIIKSVKPAGGREMDALSYANGKRIKIGEVFG